MKVDPKEVLEKIRNENQPRVRIHTGNVEEMRELRPGASRANEYVSEWLEDPEHTADKDISPAALEADLVGAAEASHQLGWAHTQDDAEAWDLQRRIILERASGGDKKAAQFLPHLMTTDGYNAFGWHGKWYHYGCQSLDVEEKYAASLCATKVAPGELEYVRLPWPCFVVRVPKFLQHLKVNGEGLRLIVVNHFRYSGNTKVTGKQNLEGEIELERFNLSLMTANKYRILPASSLADWAQPNVGHGYDEFRLVEVEHSEVDRRQLEVIGRLVLGAIISMNTKAHRRLGPLGPKVKPSLGSPRYGTDNQVVLHKIGRPVKVDARETIAAYVSGQKSRVTNVRTLVAGHWKNQPHGPKSSLRRWQHIECYWRGDEEAPLIVRPHVIEGGTG